MRQTWKKWAKYRTSSKMKDTKAIINYTEYKCINTPTNESWSH